MIILNLPLWEVILWLFFLVPVIRLADWLGDKAGHVLYRWLRRHKVRREPCGRRLRECIDDVCRSMGECAWPPEDARAAGHAREGAGGADSVSSGTRDQEATR